jgi:hypothetical protein
MRLVDGLAKILRHRSPFPGGTPPRDKRFRTPITQSLVPNPLPVEVAVYRHCLRSLCLATLLVSPVTAQTASKTISVGESPESVCRGFGGRLYVTLINGEEPGDGSIVEIDGDDVKEFARGLNDPKGIVYVGGFLITADQTTIWKVGPDGKATRLVELKNFPQPVEFLNDVAVGKADDAVYVSEMSNPSPMFDPSGERKLWPIGGSEDKDLPRKGRVYRVTLKGEIDEVIPAGGADLRFPNGVAVEIGDDGKDIVYAADFFVGKVFAYDAIGYREVASGMRGFDGLAVTPDAFYGSSWTEGKVWRVDRKTGRMDVILDGLQSAADFYHDAESNQLIIPDMIAGTLTFLPFN